MLEGVVGNGTRSYIAIDDLITGPGCIPYNQELPLTTTSTTGKPCGANGFQCTDGTCIQMSQVCDFLKDCSTNDDEAECGTCNFENGQCGW